MFDRTRGRGCGDGDILDWRIVTGQDLEILGQIGEDGQSIQELALHHVLGIEQGGDPQLLLRHVEGQAVVAEHIVRVQTVVVDKMRIIVMDDGTEAKTTPPTSRHVDDVDILVVRRDPLGPGLQRFGS